MFYLILSWFTECLRFVHGDTFCIIELVIHIWKAQGAECIADMSQISIVSF